MTIERNFSCWEKAGRGFIGVMAVCFSLGLALLSKTVQELFKIKKEILHFGIRVLDDEKLPKIPVSQIKYIAIGKFCLQSSPCQHDCIVRLKDGDEKFLRFDAVEIRQLIQRMPEQIRNTWGDRHFFSQDRQNRPENRYLAFDQ
ncbi:MAG: hypothetical protein HWD61_00575 [Parachlamydiaceae bacterium]|nr:MAG: hypothetical protein HWD61_00575 [Parachlamydiaceae bacterium]